MKRKKKEYEAVCFFLIMEENQVKQRHQLKPLLLEAANVTAHEFEAIYKEARKFFEAVRCKKDPYQNVYCPRNDKRLIQRTRSRLLPNYWTWQSHWEIMMVRLIPRRQNHLTTHTLKRSRHGGRRSYQRL
jgi:hypothetical protein